MSVGFKSNLTSQNVNDAFMSRTSNTDTVGEVGLLNPGSGGNIANTQQTINDNTANIAQNTNDIAQNAADIAALPAVPTDTDDLSEGSANFYYTEARVSANTDVAANTAKVSADGSIDTHSDVDTSSVAPNDTEVLTWVSANGAWEPKASAGGGDSWGDPVDANIVPDTDITYNLGSNTEHFVDVYAEAIKSVNSNLTINSQNGDVILDASNTVLLQSSLDADGNALINLIDPTSDQDAATKKYVDDSTSPQTFYRLYGGGNIAWSDTPGYTNVNSLNTVASDAEARIPYNATYHNQTNDISAFCWFKTGNNNFAVMFSHTDVDTPGTSKWSLMKQSNLYEVRINGGGQSKLYRSIGLSPADNSWHHYGFTFSSNVLKMYVDGVELTGGSLNKLTDGTVNTLNSINKDVMIGSWLDVNPSAFFLGLLDENSYWDKALTGAEVTELYNGGATFDLTTHSANANLISWYKMDGDTLPTVTDVVNAQNGTAEPSAVLSTDVVAGAAGSSGLSFDDDFVVEVPGLNYSDNVIPSSESPIALTSDLDVAYVTPNLVAPGGNLSVTVDTLDNVPSGGLVVARRIDDSVSVVRVEGLRLEDGESGKI